MSLAQVKAYALKRATWMAYPFGDLLPQYEARTHGLSQSHTA